MSTEKTIKTIVVQRTKFAKKLTQLAEKTSALKTEAIKNSLLSGDELPGEEVPIVPEVQPFAPEIEAFRQKETIAEDFFERVKNLEEELMEESELKRSKMKKNKDQIDDGAIYIPHTMNEADLDAELDSENSRFIVVS